MFNLLLFDTCQKMQSTEIGQHWGYELNSTEFIQRVTGFFILILFNIVYLFIYYFFNLFAERFQTAMWCGDEKLVKKKQKTNKPKPCLVLICCWLQKLRTATWKKKKKNFYISEKKWNSFMAW